MFSLFTTIHLYIPQTRFSPFIQITKKLQENNKIVQLFITSVYFFIDYL